MIVSYEKKYDQIWDEFVLNESVNGNFLQTRNFLNYHSKGKFVDASILIFRNTRIAAVLPGNEIDDGKTLIAHQGSTFGGIIIGIDFANSTNYNWIFDELISYFIQKGYQRVELRMHNWLYSPVERRNELLEYYFQLNGFTIRSEIGFYLDLGGISSDYASGFEKLKRRKLSRALKCGLVFRELSSDIDVCEFYDVLVDNMKKFNTVPVHTREEILEFKNSRLRKITSFWGVFLDTRLIAGSMVWNFCNKKVFHTQYLASLREYLDYCPNEFLYFNLIQEARNLGYRFLSYGTASLDNGCTYNESLGRYKEGFNTDSYLNKCYIWENNQ